MSSLGLGQIKGGKLEVKPWGLGFRFWGLGFRV